MKLLSDCIACQVNVRLKDIQKLTSSEEERINLISKILEMLYNEINSGNYLMPIIATKLFRFIKDYFNNPDPYKDEKLKANIEGIKIYERLKNYVADLKELEKFHFCIKISILGNSIDFGVASYKPPTIEELLNELEKIHVVNINQFPIVKGKLILYLLDNCGEAALDKLLAEYLSELGNKVIAVVKSGSFQNDVTIDEINELKLDESFDKVIETGTDAASILIDEISEELKKLIRECNLIIAKGMAHYEYLTELNLNKPIIYMLKAKCKPVAQNLNVQQGSYVIKIS